MESIHIAYAFINEAQTRAPHRDDWEQDLTAMQRRSDIYDRQRAIQTAFVRIARVFRRPSATLRAAHV